MSRTTMGKIQKIRWFKKIKKLNRNIICNSNDILVTNDTRIDSKNRKEPRFAYPSKTSRKHPCWLHHSSFGLKIFYVKLKNFWIIFFLNFDTGWKKILNPLKAKLSGQHFTSISKKGWHKLKLSSLDATENSLNLSDIEVFGTSLEIIELAFNEMTQISLINPGLRLKFCV